MTYVYILLAWTIASILLGIIVGKTIKWGLGDGF